MYYSAVNIHYTSLTYLYEALESYCRSGDHTLAQGSDVLFFLDTIHLLEHRNGTAEFLFREGKFPAKWHKRLMFC